MKNQIVVLNTSVKTLSHQFNAGDSFKVLGWHGTMVRLSRKGDNAKLIALPEAVGLNPFPIQSSSVETIKEPTSEANKIYDTPHSDASGASREICIATVLAGKDSGRIVMHMTPAEERSYNDGMAKLAEMYPG